ncbi:MAG: spore cortex biosynthesis protein YabQ [Oscillospiraceae bacterium]|nr:spore cortex biosynthesis protein YabQ [Oscillospiraceae bacterium]
MMFEPQSYTLVMWDAVYSMAAGFVVGFVYQLLGVFLYRGKLAAFIRDVVSWAVFAVVIFSFVISFANYKVLRWYNIAFGLVGWRCFPFAFSRACNKWSTAVTDKTGCVIKYCIKSIHGKISAFSEKKRIKKKKITQKNKEELLKETEVLLYN